MASLPFFVRPLPYTTSGVGNELSSNPAQNLSDFHYAGATWKSSGAAGLYFLADLGSAQTVDFIGMFSANAIATTRYLFYMDSTSGGVVSGSPAFNPFAGAGQLFINPATTGRTLYHSHYEFASAQTYRWLNFQIPTHTGDFEAAFLVIGKKIAPTRYYDNDYERGFEDLSRFDLGRNGVPDIAYGSVLPSIKFSLSWLSESEHEDYIDPLLKACGTTEPLLLCFDPAATTSRQGRTFFGRLAASKRGQRRHFNVWQRDFEIFSLI